MEVIDARVRKCKDINIIIDKKMRERRIEHERYIIPLSPNTHLETDEFVKVVRKSDFEKLGEIITSLKNERNNLKEQVRTLQALLDVQKEFMDKIENTHSKTAKGKDLRPKGLFKGLF